MELTAKGNIPANLFMLFGSIALPADGNAQFCTQMNFIKLTTSISCNTETGNSCIPECENELGSAVTYVYMENPSPVSGNTKIIDANYSPGCSLPVQIEIIKEGGDHEQ